MRRSGQKRINKFIKDPEGRFTAFIGNTVPTIIEHRGLVLNINRWIVKYKDNPSLDISPNTKPIKMLIKLFDNCDCIVSYGDLARSLDLNSNVYESFATDALPDKLILDALKEIKRELISILHRAGMPAEEAKEFILNKRGVGYLVPE